MGIDVKSGNKMYVSNAEQLTRGLEKLQSDRNEDLIDREAARGAAKIPGFVEDTGEVSSGVIRSLYTGGVTHPIRSIYRGAAGLVSKKTEEQELADNKTRAQTTVNQMTARIADEGEISPGEWDKAAPAVVGLLTAFPVLLPYAENAVASLPVKAAKYLFTTSAPLDMVATKLMEATRIWKDPDAPVTQTSDRPPLLRRISTLREVTPNLERVITRKDSIRNPGVNNLRAASFNRLRQDDEDAPTFEEDDANALAEELEVAGTLGMYAARTMADLIRKVAPNGKLTDADLAHMFAKGQMPETKIPIKVALLEPGTQKASIGTGKHQVEVDLPFKVNSPDPTTALLLAALVADSDKLPPIDGATTLLVEVRDQSFLQEVNRKIISLVDVKEAKLADGKSVEVNATMLWPLVDGILRQGRAGVGAGARMEDGTHVYDFLAGAPVMQFVSDNPELASALNARWADSGSPQLAQLRVLLTLAEVMRLHYVDQADLKEAAADLLKGTIIGAIYELAAEQIFTDNGNTLAELFASAGYWANVVGATAIDTVDNALGRQAAARMTLRAEGIKPTPEALFGPGANQHGRLRQILDVFQLVARGGAPAIEKAEPTVDVGSPHVEVVVEDHTGRQVSHSVVTSKTEEEQQRVEVVVEQVPAVPPVASSTTKGAGQPELPNRKAAKLYADAYRASGLGALLGAALQIGPMIPISEATSTIPQRIGGTAGATIATSMAIPLEFVTMLLDRMLAHKALLESGVVVLPDGVKAEDESAVEAHLLNSAIHDITASIGSQASLKAFSLSAFLSVAWTIQYGWTTGRPALQSLIFGVGPGFENLLTLAMAASVQNGARQAYRDFEATAYAQAMSAGLQLKQGQYSEAALRSLYYGEYQSAIRSPWALGVAHTFNFVSYPVQRAAMRRGNIVPKGGINVPSERGAVNVTAPAAAGSDVDAKAVTPEKLV